MYKNNLTASKRKHATFTTVSIHCKPIVKAFLENNFGTPVHIPDDHFLMKHAVSQLSKKNSRNDNFTGYEQKIELSICTRTLKYDGFTINAMNTRNFNTAVLSYIKDISHISLDSLLVASGHQEKFVESMGELIKMIRGKVPEKEFFKLRKQLNEWNMEIQDAIEHVITNVLKLDYDVISYDTLKKSYYRYRNPAPVVDKNIFPAIVP